MTALDTPPTTTRPTPADIIAQATRGTSDNRMAIHAYVSCQAHNTWHTFAAEQGASVSALLEGFAVELGADPVTDEQPMAARLDAVVRIARQIDAARRRRVR